MGTAAWQQISGVLGLNCGRCPVHTVRLTPDRDSVFGKETLMMPHENKSCASYIYTIQPNRGTESVSERVDLLMLTVITSVTPTTPRHMSRRKPLLCAIVQDNVQHYW